MGRRDHPCNAPLGRSRVDPATFGFRRFLPSLWRYRSPPAHVLIASLFVQLFALITPLQPVRSIRLPTICVFTTVLLLESELTLATARIAYKISDKDIARDNRVPGLYFRMSRY